MSEICKAAELRVERIKEAINEQNARKEKVCRYLDELRKARDIVTKFDEGLWHSTVESVTVKQDKSLIFTFRDGTEIPVKPTKTN